MNHQLLTSKSGKVFPFVWHSILRLFIGIRVFRTKALYDMDGCTCLLVYCTSPSTPQQWPLDWCFSGCSVLRKAATFSQQDLLVDRCMGLVHLLLPFSLKSQRGITLLTWCLCRNIPGHLRCQCRLRKPERNSRGSSLLIGRSQLSSGPWEQWECRFWRSVAWAEGRTVAHISASPTLAIWVTS